MESILDDQNASAESDSPAHLPEEKLPFYPFRFMAVDTGSNAIKYRVWQIEEGGAVQQIAENRYPIRLGSSVFETGKLSAHVIGESAKAFEKIRQDYTSMGVHALRAVATSAMREASNALSLVRKVNETSGIVLEILPDAEEARMIALGILGTRKQLRDQYLIIDIGGGSTEVILARDPDIVVAQSMRLGAVRLHEMFFGKLPADAQALELAVDHIEDVLNKTLQIREPLGESLRCLGSAGTINTLCEMANKNGAQAVQTFDLPLTLPQLEEITKVLSKASPAQVAKQYGVEPRRSEILLSGALVLRALMRRLKIEQIIRVAGGVSDGLLQSFLERNGLRESRLFDHDRAFLNQALAFGDRCRFNRQHAKQVARLAVSLFDQLAAQHQLGRNERAILKGAALLHEVGQLISFSAHHKHSAYMIRNADLPGLSEREKLMTACVARYHRKAHPKPRHEGYMELDNDSRLVVRKLAAILRIADALDREQQSLVSQVNVQIHGQQCDLYVTTHFQASIEIWNAQRKAELFEEVFGLVPRFLIANV